MDRSVWDDDPVAAKTSWKPAKKGGISIRSHESMRAGGDRVTLQPTALARAFVALFPLVGAGVIGYGLLFGFEGPVPWLPWCIGTVFLLAGPFLRKLVRPFTLDRSLGIYWNGSGKKSPGAVRVSDARAGRLADVHAVQIVSERVRMKEGGSFASHEVNLVLKHGRRVNVCDHGDLSGTRADAARIAQFLGVPLWDASDG